MTLTNQKSGHATNRGPVAEEITLGKRAKAYLRDMFLFDQEAARHRWVRKVIATLPAGGRILDAGCGTQPYRDSCGHLEYFAQDFGGYDGIGDGVGCQIAGFYYGKLDYQCDVWSIPAESASFDAIMFTEVIEHIPYARETIIELARLLAPGGTLILTAPYACIPHFTHSSTPVATQRIFTGLSCTMWT